MKKSFCDFCGKEITKANELFEKGIFILMEKNKIKLEINLNFTNKPIDIDCCISCIINEVINLTGKQKKEKQND